MKHDYDMQHFNVLAFAKADDHWVGEARLAQFARLMTESHGLGGDAVVQFEAQGTLRLDASGAESAWLHVSAQVAVPLTCQRCLGPVEVPLDFERDYRFVETEATAEAQDEVSEEDVLAISRDFNLLELIEDELLMELPPVPKHGECPVPIQFQAADADFCDELAEKPNPFAVLGQLKKKALP
jgi:uncharacterized protein